ncbi:Phage integrase [Acidipropionibacterium acidipropionici ATCC 4875]|uniref:Phage integrase n=1 Tax=Acidipropionibacterium acidipropionici (strain ATCC 4875 / DSM 20272 / JCM 6432 / NBRC 12425 / NCIMB 8070 / 4) TaxID=1171373 RepID=K7RPI4_ACIA4|nr:Phage integrase [Acidipropionibacterium acidipropionici ATCC 4875]
MGKRESHRRTFGSTRKLASGNWQARYIGPDHHRHVAPSTFVDREYAEGWLSEERKLISQGLWTPPADRWAEALEAEARENSTPTVAEWIETVILRRARRVRKPLAPTTVDLYRKDARLSITGTRLGRRRLDDVTRADVATWWDHLDRGTPTQNARAYQLLCSVMRDAVDDGFIEASPCHLKGAGKPVPAHSAATVEALTPAQTLTYARAVPEHYRVALMVTVWCGLRSGEVRGLRRRDIDLRNRVIHVEQAVSRVKVDPGTWAWRITLPKTAAGRRTVAIPAADQRQGRAVQPNPRRRVGLREALRQRSRARRSLRDLAPSLQSPQTPHRDRRPDPLSPRSQRHGEVHLGRS